MLRRAWQGGFHMGFWALSFPLAALTGLSFVVGEGMVTAATSGNRVPAHDARRCCCAAGVDDRRDADLVRADG